MTDWNLRGVLLALTLGVFTLALPGCPEPPSEPPNPQEDAGSDAGDEGETETGGAASSEQIEAVRAVTDPDATHDPALAVELVAVTDVKTAHGEDPAGFFVQAEAEGPALFVAIDPAELDPAPVVGDLVSFEVVGSTVVDGQHRVTGIDGFSRVGAGFDVLELAQDLSASVDLATNVAGYESELIEVRGITHGLYDACGEGFVCTALITEGVPVPGSGLMLRLPEALATSLELSSGCRMTVGPSALWRRGDTALVSADEVQDVEVEGCGLNVVSVVPLRSTKLLVTFDGELDVATVLPAAFVISSAEGALAVTGAVVDGTRALLTTAAQEAGRRYTLTVAAAVADVEGRTVGTELSVTFQAFQLATVRINEADLNAADNCDRVELRVVAGGPMDGYQFYDRGNTALYTFPAGFTVATNDLIVLHMGKNKAECHGGEAPEDEAPGAPPVTHPKHHAGAYDVWSASDVDLFLGDASSLRLMDAEGGYVDFLLIGEDGGGYGGAALLSWIPAGDAGAWSKPSGDYTTGNYVDHALLVTRSPEDGTFQRINDGDTNHRDDWTQRMPASIGALNAGQSPLP